MQKLFWGYFEIEDFGISFVKTEVCQKIIMNKQKVSKCHVAITKNINNNKVVLIVIYTAVCGNWWALLHYYLRMALNVLVPYPIALFVHNLEEIKGVFQFVNCSEVTFCFKVIVFCIWQWSTIILYFITLVIELLMPWPVMEKTWYWDVTFQYFKSLMIWSHHPSFGCGAYGVSYHQYKHAFHGY